MGHEVTQAYKVKNTDGKFNAAMDRFTPELQNHVKTVLADYCQFFGYFKDSSNEDDRYQYFDPPEGWTANPNLGYYKDVTQVAIDSIDGTTVEQRKKDVYRFDSHYIPTGPLFPGEIKIKDP